MSKIHLDRQCGHDKKKMGTFMVSFASMYSGYLWSHWQNYEDQHPRNQLSRTYLPVWLHLLTPENDYDVSMDSTRVSTTSSLRGVTVFFKTPVVPRL